MLTERSRAVLHRRLTHVVGDEEAVSEMLSNFPANDDDPYVTRSMLAVVEANLHRAMAQQSTHLVMWMIGIAVALAGVMVAAIGLLT